MINKQTSEKSYSGSGKKPFFKNIILNIIVMGICGLGVYFWMQSELDLASDDVLKSQEKVLIKKTNKPPDIKLQKNSQKNSVYQNPLKEKNLPIVLKKNTEIEIKALAVPTKIQEQNKKAAKFRLEDGLVTIAGDIVLGIPKTADFPNQGWIEPPDFLIWDSAEIPFYIQSNLVNSERIYEAFELFRDSPVHFVALSEQADAIVFEEKTGACKSYVGKVGGLQPIWIGPDCSVVDIAHEIMHALGFIHEQNRTDRDHFIEIVWENIKEEYRYNFEMLPDFYMRVTGASGFDFNSIMIYPSSSFAKKERLITIKSKQNRQIKPSLSLSAMDLARLQKFYGQ